MPQIDPAFLALPMRVLAEAALQRATELGASHADFRMERLRTQNLRLRDARLEAAVDGEQVGFAVRVVHEGTWGFAAGVDLTVDAVRRVAELAVEVAKVSAPVNSDPVVLAPEPSHGDVTWISAYDVNPFEVPDAEKVGLLTDWSERLMAHDGVDHTDATLAQVLENKFYADTAGTTTTQQRVRLHPQLTAVAVDRAAGGFETMRTLAPPVGRGFEYLTGTGWDFPAELAELPALLAEKVKAPRVDRGRLRPRHRPDEPVADHPRVDRPRHRARPGPGLRGRLRGHLLRHPRQAGQPALRLADHARHRRPHRRARPVHRRLRRRGRRRPAVGPGARRHAGRVPDRPSDRAAAGLGRSNGCAFADSPGHVPVQRMANVSLAAGPDGPSTDELISRVERGIYVVGDKSWSIDMQRYNFQFTGQRFYAIADGELAGQLRDVAYQATTTDFWGSMEAVGGPQTYVLGGAFNCGKAQPGQVAPVSHGCPSALFRGVRILNTVQEGGK